MLLVLITLALAAIASAHSVISYPGWRGNSLITNDTFPYGMQWMYPCESPRPQTLSRDTIHAPITTANKNS